MKRIAICGSITFMTEMEALKAELIKQGFAKVYCPVGFKDKSESDASLKEKLTQGEDGERKIKFDLIKKHYEKIKKSDSILVANYSKKGISNYIGGNTLIEMGFAHVLNKPIYLLNPIPEMAYTPEIIAMQPIVVMGDLRQIS